MKNIENTIAALLPSLEERLAKNLSPHIQAQYPVKDIVNDTFLRAMRRLDSIEYRGNAQLLGWLETTANNIVIDWIRPRARRQMTGAEHSDLYTELTNSGELTPSRECSHKEACRLLNEALDGLSELYQQVLRLRYLEGLNFAAIGEVIGKNDGAARGLHRNALAELKRKLGKSSMFFFK